MCVLDVAGRMTCTVKTPRPLPSPCVARPVASRADTCGSHCCFRQAALVPSEGETPPRSAAAPAVRCSRCCRGQRLARGGLSGKDAEGAASWGHGRVRAESSPGGTDADDGACSTRTHRCRVVSACSVPTSPRAPHIPRGSAGPAGLLPLLSRPERDEDTGPPSSTQLGGLARGWQSPSWPAPRGSAPRPAPRMLSMFALGSGRAYRLSSPGWSERPQKSHCSETGHGDCHRHCHRRAGSRAWSTLSLSPQLAGRRK